jgi:hypothetical protein
MYTQNKRDIMLGTQIGEPVPGEDTLYGNRHVFLVRGYRF